MAGNETVYDSNDRMQSISQRETKSGDDVASADAAQRLGGLGVKANHGADAPKREDYVSGPDDAAGAAKYSKALREYQRMKAQNTALAAK